MPSTSTGTTAAKSGRPDALDAPERAVPADHADETGAAAELGEPAHDREDRDRDDDGPAPLAPELPGQDREQDEVGDAVDDGAGEVERAAARDGADVLLVARGRRGLRRGDWSGTLISPAPGPAGRGAWPTLRWSGG